MAQLQAWGSVQGQELDCKGSGDDGEFRWPGEGTRRVGNNSGFSVSDNNHLLVRVCLDASFQWPLLIAGLVPSISYLEKEKEKNYP